jgi:hypothetical protein
MEPTSPDSGATIEVPQSETQVLVSDEDLISRDAQIVIERMTSLLGPLLALAFFVGALGRPLSRSRLAADAIVGVLPPSTRAPSHHQDLFPRFTEARQARLSPGERFSPWSGEPSS